MVDEVLEPVVRGFDLAGHVCELETDDRVVDETLAESLALVGIFHRLLVADTGEAEALDDDADTLVVEVGHDDLEALVLLANEVFDWHLYVLKGDVGCATGPDTLAIHSSGRNTTGFALDEEHRDTVHALVACSDGSGEVVAPHTICDPLFLAVHDVMLAVFGQLRFASEVCNVATSI